MPIIDKNARICIVGAGISGLTTALYLQNNGYSKVTVLEKSGEVGGKCLSIHPSIPGNPVYEMKAIQITPDYDHIRALLKQFNIQAVPMPSKCLCSEYANWGKI